MVARDDEPNQQAMHTFMFSKDKLIKELNEPMETLKRRGGLECEACFGNL